MKNIWIIGDGGFAVEVFYWTKQTLELQKDQFQMKGFLTDVRSSPDILSRLGENEKYCNVLSCKNFEPKDNDYFVCGIGDSHIKRKVINEININKFKFINIIHPSAVVSDNVQMGKGVFICPHVTVAGNVQLGDFVMLNMASIVSHDGIVGNFSSISPFSGAMGYVHIGEEVFVGAGAVITPHIEIGDKSIIGAGAVVIRNVKSETVIVGNPGKELHKK